MSQVGCGTNGGNVSLAQTLMHWIGVLVWYLLPVGNHGTKATRGRKDFFQFTDCSPALLLQSKN